MSKKPELIEGLSRLDDFIGHVSPGHAYPSLGRVVVESIPPAIKGLVCKYEDSPRYASFLAGFARHAGDGGGYQEVLQELDKETSIGFDEVRSRSASLRLSAKLAEREARRMAGRPKELH